MTAKSRTFATYEMLKSDLLEGRYGSNTKLKIDSIARDLNVSPGAVREALSRLTSDGLVVSKPQRGFFTNTLSERNLADVTAVLIDIETTCLRRSILLGDLAWEGHIQGVLHQLQHTVMIADQDRHVINRHWSECHLAFHYSLVAACDSPSWLHLRHIMILQFERYCRFLLPLENVSAIQEDHAAIAKAALARQADLAVERMREHLQGTADRLLASWISETGPHPHSVSHR